MKTRKMMTAAMAAIMTMIMSVTALAGWQTGFDGEKARWWYDNNDGTWMENGWHWIDDNQDGVAECYYFDGNGYILTDTTTPDGYTVYTSGAWIENGIIQTQTAAAQSQSIANVNVTAGSTKSLSDYGYTNGLSDLIYDLPNLTRADVEAMFGDEAVVSDGTSDGSGVTSYKYGNESFIIFFNDNNGTVKGATLSFDRAFDGLSNNDVKNESTVTKVAKYLQNNGYDVHVYAQNEAFVFRISTAGKTLKISSNSVDYKSGMGQLSIAVED